jgi:hypothetical protein
MLLEALLSSAVALGLYCWSGLPSPNHLVCPVILLCLSFALGVFAAVVGF